MLGHLLALQSHTGAPSPAHPYALVDLHKLYTVAGGRAIIILAGLRASELKTLRAIVCPTFAGGPNRLWW